MEKFSGKCFLYVWYILIGSANNNYHKAHEIEFAGGFVVKELKRKPFAGLMALVLLASLVLPVYASVSAEEDGLVAMPIAENQECKTYQNVKMYGCLQASDPNGGMLKFEIVEMPKKGVLTLNEEHSCQFVYEPNAGKTGKDSFTFCVRDEEGNVSDPATVKIEIAKSKSGIRYADMTEHASHAAAVYLAEKDVYVGRKVGQEYFFDPDVQVSRSEFLAMVMAAAGLKEMPEVSVTGFSDDESIPTWAKAYASEALNNGMIEGKTASGRIVFSANEPITYNEAAVILNRTMDVTDVGVESFRGENIAVWAVQSVANLTSVHVVGGNMDGKDYLNRAEAAQMLSSAMQLMETRSGGFFSCLK